jgi:AcrR family transcriptional regulator
MSDAQRAAPGGRAPTQVMAAPRASSAPSAPPPEPTARDERTGTAAHPGSATQPGEEGHTRPAAHPGQDAPASPDTTHHRHHDTRQRIQSVALELFAEQGYDKTSIREIAERLGVTKAALYYHFKSKEDIVASLVEDYFGQVDELVAWGKAQPSTPATRAEVLTRYYDIVLGGSEVFRMLQHNQASVNSLKTKNRGELFRERMDALVSVLTEADAPLATQLRAAVALASVSFGCMFYADRVEDPAELRATVLDIGYGLTGARP